MTNQMYMSSESQICKIVNVDNKKSRTVVLWVCKWIFGLDYISRLFVDLWSEFVKSI